MTVHCCPGCQGFLTFRPNWRPSNPDLFKTTFASCPTCGLASTCAAKTSLVCTQCSDEMTLNVLHEPTGKWRLPKHIREAEDPWAALAAWKVEAQAEYDQGLITRMELEAVDWWGEIVDEVFDR